MHSFSSLFRTPEAADEAQAFSVRLLHYLLLLLIGLSLIFPLFASEPLELVMMVALLAALCISYALLHTNRFHAASIVFLGSVWITITIAIYYANGLINSLVGAYVIVIMLTALLFSSTVVIFVTGASILSALILTIGSGAGVLPLNIHPPVLGERFFFHASIFMATGLLLSATSRVIRTGFARIRTSEQTLLERNQTLERKIIEHQQAEARLKRYGQRMEILHHIDRGIIETIPIDTLLQSIVDLVRQLLHCELVAVLLIHKEQDNSLIFVKDQADSLGIPWDDWLANARKRLEQHAIPEIAVVPDIRGLAKHDPVYQHLIDQGIVSLLNIRLVTDNDWVGIFTMMSTSPTYFVGEYQEVAEEVAAQIAIAFRHMQMSQEITQHVQDLEQRVAERSAELQAAKERVEAIFNTSADGILLARADLRIEQTNPAFNTLFACQPDDYVNKSLVALIHPADVDRLLDIIQAGRDTSQGQYLEVQAQRKDGTTVEIEFSIGYMNDDSIVCTLHDITRRKTAERQLRYLASLQENMSDAVIGTDETFHIQSWNNAATVIYGWTREEVIGKTVSEILPTRYLSDTDRERSVKQLRETGSWQGEVVQQRKDGSEVYILGTVDMLQDEHGKPLGVVAVNHDITERKNAEDALRQAFEKERELGMLKSQFVSMASHEFRTPLATILSASEMLSGYRKRMNEEQIQDRLDKIKEQVGHLTSIMDDVLLLARMQARHADFNPITFNLDELCRTIIEEFTNQANMRHRFIYSAHPATWQVTMDKRLMRQIIMNLVTNAVKYSPSAQPVTIKLDYEGTCMSLMVRDEGIGIPADDLKHLFQPFYRATNVGEVSGTGLGMVIVKEAVELHSGTIEVESQPGQGTTVIVRLPTPQ